MDLGYRSTSTFALRSWQRVSNALEARALDTLECRNGRSTTNGGGAE
jgi:hypothetical protein